ncbi:hypothetical protein [Halohasta litorea]|uniref:Uncharacterized protein n=1 Tax=Halohasta litorea TaxID=869891 RepID=A0ABD6D3P6_9EURY|nr:hypothetical protein [Halohasta litorea]MEA1930995.1 hypothetical protein [Euryarchaeota archaeon]
MATDETQSHDGENRQEGRERVAHSERTVTVDNLSPAELRCGITLRDAVEPEETRQPSSADESAE